MSHETTLCFWTAVPLADPPPGMPAAYWYVRDEDGKIEFTQDVVDAMQFNIDTPHDRGAINDALRAKGMHMTMRAGPRLSLDGLEFSIDEYPDAEEAAAEEQEPPPELTVDIRGRHDAVLILARLIGQNHMLLLGSEQKEIATTPMETDTTGMRYTRVTIRVN